MTYDNDNVHFHKNNFTNLETRALNERSTRLTTKCTE
jgi:hypothetical protein